MDGYVMLPKQAGPEGLNVILGGSSPEWQSGGRLAELAPRVLRDHGPMIVRTKKEPLPGGHEREEFTIGDEAEAVSIGELELCAPPAKFYVRNHTWKRCYGARRKDGVSPYHDCLSALCELTMGGWRGDLWSVVACKGTMRTGADTAGHEWGVIDECYDDMIGGEAAV